jgi:RNA polymerase sigma-70 factor (ECF subfamily)
MDGTPIAIDDSAQTTIATVFQAERDRILATVIRLVGDFDLAEEMTQEAFLAAIHAWPAQGIPDNPRAWLIGTARNKAVDRIRKDKRLREELAQVHEPTSAAARSEENSSVEDAIGDERLRLIFTCCHPSLAPEAQIALTLRTLCGLSTEQIARVFLTPVPTMAQRIVRAKNKIKETGIPYRVPPASLLRERLETVLATVYLIFTEGYAATSGEVLVRTDLCSEAIRLATLLSELLPDVIEIKGLLALLLLHDSRRQARTDVNGDIVPLEEQDRSLWDQAQIRKGIDLTSVALAKGAAHSRYTIEAAIAALHAEATTAADTDWRQIAGLYSVLLQVHPSPVIELNRAVAIAMLNGPDAGMKLLDPLQQSGQLRDSHLLPAARAYFLTQLGRDEEAQPLLRQAIALAGNEPERRFLGKRLRQLK